MTNIASAPAGASGLSAMRRSQVRMRAEAIQADRRAQVRDRVDRLVRGMESVARRLSSNQISSTQRSVLVSRFNDMQRRVNQIDGVVGSEGRGDGLARVGAGKSVGVDSPAAAGQTFRQLRQLRRELQVERQAPPQPPHAAPEPTGNMVDLEA